MLDAYQRVFGEVETHDKEHVRDHDSRLSVLSHDRCLLSGYDHVWRGNCDKLSLLIGDVEDVL